MPMAGTALAGIGAATRSDAASVGAVLTDGAASDMVMAGAEASDLAGAAVVSLAQRTEPVTATATAGIRMAAKVAAAITRVVATATGVVDTAADITLVAVMGDMAVVMVAAEARSPKPRMQLQPEV